MLTRRELLLYLAGAGLAQFALGCASSPHLRQDKFPPLASQKETYLGLATSVEDEFEEDTRVEGALPSELRGTLFRNSAGLFERGGLRKRTMFEGDGLIRAYRIEDGRVGFMCRFVKTEKFVEESKADSFIYPTFSTQAPGGFLSNFWAGGKIKSQAQISVWMRNGKLYAFDESSLPYLLDPETLKTIGPTDLGVKNAYYSAHPKTDQRTGHWLHFGLHYGKYAEILICIFDKDDRVISKQTIRLPRYIHLHDFFATERYLVFNLHPLEVEVFDFLLGRKSLAESFRWRPEKGNLIMVLERRSDTSPVFIETESIFMWHSINAYDDGDAIIADFVGYKSPDHFLGKNSPVYAVMKGEKGVYKDAGEIRRYIIEPKNRRLKSQRLTNNSGYEWPMIDLRNRCYPYRHAYVARTRRGDDFFWSGISAIDLKSGKERVYYFQEGHYCSEPVFAPISSAQHDALAEIEKGWLLTEVYDGINKRNYLAVLRSDALEDGPVAMAHLSRHLPFSMHGFWQAKT